MSIAHNLYKAFHPYLTLESCDVFRDMAEAPDKVRHKRLIVKFRSGGISDFLLHLITSFLCDRFQRVLLNSQTSEWLLDKVGFPQSSILGPHFFLIYITDLSDNLLPKVKLFADGTSFFML